MNKVLLVGYLAVDPDYRNYTERELKMARFRIAVNDIRNFSQTYFFNCVAWNQTADYIGNNLKKGDFVCIDGKLTTRSYVDNEGKKNTSTEIVIENIKNIGSRKKVNEDDEKVSIDEVFQASNENEINENDVANETLSSDTENKENEESSTIDWEEDLI